jgi:hypothetical protein
MQRRWAAAAIAGSAVLLALLGITAYFVWGSWDLADKKASVLQLFATIILAFVPFGIFVARKIQNSAESTENHPSPARSPEAISVRPATVPGTAEADVLTVPSPASFEGSLRFGTPGRRGCLVQFAAVIAAVSVLTLVILGLHGNDRGCCSGDTPSASPTPSPASSTDLASAQAEFVNRTLESSGQTRQALNRAIERVLQCQAVKDAVSTLDTVISDRQEQVTAVNGNVLSAIPDGSRIQTALLQVLQTSLDADRDWRNWAAAKTTSCSKNDTGSAAYKAATTASSADTSAKKEFAALWNPVAATMGLPTRTGADF